MYFLKIKKLFIINLYFNIIFIKIKCVELKSDWAKGY